MDKFKKEGCKLHKQYTPYCPYCVFILNKEMIANVEYIYFCEVCNIGKPIPWPHGELFKDPKGVFPSHWKWHTIISKPVKDVNKTINKKGVN